MDTPEFRGVSVQGNRITFHCWEVKRFLVAAPLLPFVAQLLLKRSSITEWSDFSAVIRYAFLLFELNFLPDILVMFFSGLANFKYTVVFDGDERTVLYRNLIGTREPLPFSDVGAIKKVVGTNMGEYEFYKVVRRDRLFGKGWRLTARLPWDSELLTPFEKIIIPAVNQAVFGDATGGATMGGTPVDPRLIDNLRHYRKENSAYVLDVPRSYFYALYFVAANLFLGTVWMQAIAFSGCAAVVVLLHYLATAKRVVLNVDDKTITEENRFLKRARTTATFDSFITVSERERPAMLRPLSINLVYKHGRSGEGNILLARCFSEKRASAIAEETVAIIRAGR